MYKIKLLHFSLFILVVIFMKEYLHKFLNAEKPIDKYKCISVRYIRMYRYIQCMHICTDKYEN